MQATATVQTLLYTKGHTGTTCRRMSGFSVSPNASVTTCEREELRQYSLAATPDQWGLAHEAQWLDVPDVISSLVCT